MAGRSGLGLRRIAAGEGLCGHLATELSRATSLTACTPEINLLLTIARAPFNH